MFPSPDPQFIKSDSIILRRSEYSETSLVLLLLTRDHGTMSALAKGARRPKSIFEGEIDLLVRGQAVIIVSQRSSLHILAEFSCRERYLGLRKATHRVAAAQYVAGIAADASPEGEGEPQIYDLLANTLSGLEGGDVSAVVAFFQVHVLKLSGYMPDLRTCAECGAHIENAAVTYSYTCRGVICRKCRAEGDRTVKLSRAAVSLIGSLARGRAVMASRLRIAPALARETVSFLGHIIAAAFDREPRMLRALLGTARVRRRPV